MISMRLSSFLCLFAHGMYEISGGRNTVWIQHGVATDYAPRGVQKWQCISYLVRQLQTTYQERTHSPLGQFG
jgi:hypothetical protein